MEMRVSDFPPGFRTLTLIVNNEKKTEKGEIVVKAVGGKRRVNFISGKESFAGGTLAMDKDGIAFKTILLTYTDPKDEKQVRALEEIRNKIEQHGAITATRIIPEMGYEFDLDRKKLLAVAEIVNMLNKKIKSAKIDMDLIRAFILPEIVTSQIPKA